MQHYFALIYTNLAYCITVWGASNKNVINPSQTSWNKSVGAICSAIRLDSARPLFNSLKIFNLEDVFNYVVCNYAQISFSRSKNIFLRHEAQHNLRQTLNLFFDTKLKLLNLLHTLVLKFQYCSRNIRICESLVFLQIGLKAHTVQPAYLERFGATKTIPFIQKNHIREVQLYVYTFSEVLHAKHKNLFARHYSRRFYN